MAVRVPQKRRSIADPMERVAKSILQTVLHSKERWEITIARMRAAGVDPGEKVSYEDMKEFVKRDEYTMSMSQNWQVQMMLQMAATVLDWLPLRHWSLVVAPPEAGEFITTDNPVLLTWTEKMPVMFPPGFGVGSTEIKIPLTKQLALVARFEGQAMVLEASATVVAAVNSQAVILADRFVYSSRKDFGCLLDQSIGSGQVFLGDLRRATFGDLDGSEGRV